MSLLNFLRPKPEAVFTPKKPLNEKMYVERRTLERRFELAIRGSQHIAIFRDSGNGKTWLYQKVLKERNCSYVLVDLSIAKTDGIDNAFRYSLENPFGWQPETHTSTSAGGLAALFEISKEEGTQYTFADKPPFEKLLEEVAKLRGAHKFIVFDNLEAIAKDSDLIERLTAYILRLDNPKFAASGVRFLFVGVVSDIRVLLAGAANAGTIANRIYELPEVRRLTPFEAQKVVQTGYIDLLKIDFGDDEDAALAGTIYYSGRSAQHLHEIGLNVAFEAEAKEWRIGWPEVSQAILDWSESSLEGHAASVRARMNRIDTKVQRRNQVLYCIAKQPSDEFSVSDIDTHVRREFPHNSNVVQLGVDQILKSLCHNSLPILIRDEGTNRFRFTHPKLRIAIRHVIRKTDDGRIEENIDLAKPENE